MKPEDKNNLRKSKPKAILRVNVKDLGFITSDFLNQKDLKCLDEEIPPKKDQKFCPQKRFKGFFTF